MISIPLKTDQKLLDLIERSKRLVDAMSPEERQAMFEAQRESWVRGEFGMGSDRDEAEYRRSMRDKEGRDGN